MQNHIQTRNTVQAATNTKPEPPQDTLRQQRVDVLDLQQAIVANQLIPITHRNEPNGGVPFSALND
jgi:hypothetical protein